MVLFEIGAFMFAIVVITTVIFVLNFMVFMTIGAYKDRDREGGYGQLAALIAIWVFIIGLVLMLIGSK